jgi:hypothetical protein
MHSIANRVESRILGSDPIIHMTQRAHPGAPAPVNWWAIASRFRLAF